MRPRLSERCYGSFTFGHARQLESVLRKHLGALFERIELLPGADERVFIDIDSLLRLRVRQTRCLLWAHQDRRETSPAQKLSPLATTISTAGHTRVIAELRLRAGKTAYRGRDRSWHGADSFIIKPIIRGLLCRPRSLRRHTVTRASLAAATN